MNELFLKIVNLSISAGWLILAVLLLRLVLKRAPKWIHVLLWGLVALRLVCPLSIESALSLIPSVETIPLNIVEDTAPVIHSGVGILNDAVNPILSQSNTPALGASANPLQIALAVLEALWLLGMLAMAFYTALSYWRLRRRVAAAVRLRDNIFQSENVRSPFVLGILRPRIYLPFKINAQDRAHVIAHEQAHIRRRDHWWKPLGFLLLTIHWFNPLMWLAYALLCRDIELACDERVIKRLGSEQRADYTQALVACSLSRRTTAACPLAFGEVGVKARVRSVMNYKKPAFWTVILAVVLCVVAAVCFLTNPKPDGDTPNSARMENEADSTRVTFEAEVLEIREGYFLVRPSGDRTANRAETIEVPMQNMNPAREPQVGDRIEITCSGERLEANPARLSEVSHITVVETAAQSEAPKLSEEALAMVGAWVLDAACTEKNNPELSLQTLLGTTPADSGAFLRLKSDGTMECRMGALTGIGTWYPDGDTGRYVAELTASPEEQNNAISFYEFRESPAHERYLVLDYEGYSLYWAQSGT